MRVVLGVKNILLRIKKDNRGYGFAEMLMVAAIAFLVFSAFVAIVQPEVTALNFKARESITSIKGSGI